MRTSWQQRLLALTLAGGAVAACSAGPAVNVNNFPDPCSSKTDGSPGADQCCGYSDSATCKDGHTIIIGVAEGGTPQCNANPDPCCGKPNGVLAASPPLNQSRTCKDDKTVVEDGGADAAPE